jgi:hypothetical protein
MAGQTELLPNLETATVYDKIPLSSNNGISLLYSWQGRPNEGHYFLLQNNVVSRHNTCTLAIKPDRVTNSPIA